MDSTKIDEFNVEVPGGKVYMKRWTPEVAVTEIPVFLIHDSLGCVDLWGDFPLALSECLCRSIVAYDRLGFGQSAARKSLPSPEFVEEEAFTYFPAIKKYLCIQHYVLIGHSVGGGMAINIAARDPDCKAVVTMSAQAFVEDLTIKGIKDAQEMFAQPGQLARLEKWHGSKAKWVLHAWIDVWLSPDFANWSLKPSIGRVKCPVLAIHGAHDQYGSSAFPEFIATNAGGSARMMLLNDCGHMPHKEKSQEVVGALKAFFEHDG